MGQSRLSLFYSLILIAFSYGLAQAQPQVAYDLLPESVQAVVWIADGTDLVNRWHRTAIHKLSQDPAIRPFFEEQHESLRNQLTEAGWRLGVKPEELTQYFQGQVAVAWLEKADQRKPYAIALVADVDDDVETTKQMFSDIERALAHQEAGKKEHTYLDQTIVQFTLPRPAGQLLEESTFIATVSGKLFASDDLELVQGLIAKLQGKQTEDKPLSKNEDFIANRQHLKLSGNAQIEYFIRPLGIARIVRAISGSKSKSNADILEVLKKQGFTSVKSLAGEVWVAAGGSDIAHRGFILAEFPLANSAAVLDFPNEAMNDVPNFVTKRAASFFTISWNAQTAFWKVRGLVDDLVGNEGVFDEVIHGIKTDINGPQVDIRTELMPLLTNDIVSVTDNQDGEISVGSRRNLIGIKVNDAEKAAKILDRVMKAEANAEESTFEGITIWNVSNEQQDLDTSEEFAEFGDFSEVEGATDEEEPEEPWLNHWAIGVLPSAEGSKEGYFLFASHAEMLEDAITQAKSGTDGLASEADYQRIQASVAQLMNSEKPCAWNITRNHLSLKVQYELFRQGKLRESESMLATLLNRVKDPPADESSPQPEKKISGENLPPFEKIASFLNPSGFKLLATANGWEFGGLLLGSAATGDEPQLSNDSQSSTARIVDTSNDPKR